MNRIRTTPVSGRAAQWRSGQLFFRPPGRSGTSGFTLIELLTATVLSVIVLLAIGEVDVARVRLSQEIRQRGQHQAEAAFALAFMARSLQQADRVVLLSPTSVQFRRFTGNPAVAGALDNAANYTWGQYRLAGADVILTDAGCAVNEIFAAVNSLDLQYVDEAPAPPGSEPPVQDNNVLQISTDSGRYTTEVVLRAGAYTNVMTGLAPAGVSDPPGSC